MRSLLLILVICPFLVAAEPSPNPFYPDATTPKLITPEWIDEEGVEAVAILSIDDMRDSAKYETYLRPILDRLKEIDGRAPLSIFTCSVDPKDPQLQTFLNEGLSIEVHTVDHPCPLLGKGGSLEESRDTVHRCIDLLDEIPNMSPVCYRMPCCDSMNSVSPRFFAEIFSKPTPNGNRLKADSSVFTLLTTPDKRFDPYLPRLKGYVGYITDHPYPYMIGGDCWELPCVVPSDWCTQNRLGVNTPQAVEDLKAALDQVVEMKGIFNFLFHPHGWIENTQVVELIDHAVAKHGTKLKFMNIREVVDQLEKNAPDWKAPGLDVDGDGVSDTLRDGGVFGEDGARWPGELPAIADPESAGSRFADLDEDGDLDIVVSTPTHQAVYLFDSKEAGWLKHSGGKREEVPENRRIPPFIREDGTDNGAWIKRGYLHWQNEDFGKSPAQIEKRSIRKLLEP